MSFSILYPTPNDAWRKQIKTCNLLQYRKIYDMQQNYTVIMYKCIVFVLFEK